MGATTTAVALVFIATAAFAAGSSPKPKKDRRPRVAEYNAGVQLTKKGHYDQAQSHFEAALDKNPQMAQAHNNFGYSCGSRVREITTRP